MPRRARASRRDEEEEEENFEEQVMDVDEADDDDAPRERGTKPGRKGGGAGSVLGPAEIERKADELCRLALFTEYRRQILKREDINKQVMGGNSKSFPEVLARANRRLKAALGYEIVELVPKAEREKNLLGAVARGDDDARKKASTKQYIVRSILEPELIQLACMPDREIQEQEEEDLIIENARPSGSILAWQTSDQVPAYGVLCVILSLILVNGKTLPEPRLRSYLKKLRLLGSTGIEVGISTAAKTIPLDTYLTTLIRQGYLDRVRVGNTTGQKTAKRGRSGVSKENPEEAADFEWRWGERAHAEISEESSRDFIVSFMTERSQSEDNGESEQVKKARLEKIEKQFRRGVERAAQTPLTGITSNEAPQDAV